MNLYGIETEDDCTKALDELIGMADTAQSALDSGSPTARRTVTELCLRLREFFKRNKHGRGPAMSPVEQIHFWPVIQRAHINAPKLSSPKTWPRGVANIKLTLCQGGSELVGHNLKANSAEKNIPFTQRGVKLLRPPVVLKVFSVLTRCGRIRASPLRKVVREHVLASGEVVPAKLS
jgi:hypothetical protein